MNPEVPMLMITMQIPVSPDTQADDVLAAIGQQVADALDEIKAKAARKFGASFASETEEDAGEFVAPEDDETARERKAFRDSLVNETHEGYTASTGPDLLAAMGYKPL